MNSKSVIPTKKHPETDVERVVRTIFAGLEMLEKDIRAEKKQAKNKTQASQ